MSQVAGGSGGAAGGLVRNANVGGSRRGPTSSISTKSSATRMKEAEAAKTKQLHLIDEAIRKKKLEVVVMEGKIRTVQRKQQLTEGKRNQDDWTPENEREFLSNQTRLIEYEEKKEVLSAELQFLVDNGTSEKEVIGKEHDAVLEDLQESNDVGRINDLDEDNPEGSQVRTSNWLENMDQPAAMFQPNITPPVNQTPHVRPEEVINVRTGLGSERSEPAVPSHDKDTLLMQLMSTQLHLMQHGKRELPQFGGQPEEWLSFKGHFHRQHRNEADSFDKLKKALRGPARDAVKFLFNCPQNVNAIMETLEMEFGRPELIIESLIKNVETAKNPDPSRPESVVEFARAVQTLVVSIQGHGKQDYLNNVYLLNKLVDKLPQQMKRSWFQWYSVFPNGVKNLEMFENFIATEKRMACEFLKPTLPKKDDEGLERRRRPGHGAFHAVAGKEDDDKRSMSPCPCCTKSGHGLDSCWSFPKKSNETKWKIVSSFKACIACLRSGHWTKSCSKKERCGVDGCSEFHHQLLHGGEPRRRRNTSPSIPQSRPNRNEAYQTDEVEPAPGAINLSLISGTDGPQAIVPVRIKGPLGEKKVYALLDIGATRSMIRKDIAEELGLSGTEGSYSYYGVSGTKTTEPNSMKCGLEIKGLYRGASYDVMVGAQTVSSLPLPVYSVNMDEIKKKFPYLQRVPAANLTDVVPDIIVGNNNPMLILSRQIVKGDPGEPVGWRSKLGWTVSGDLDADGAGAINFCRSESDDYLHDLIKESFTTDNFGVNVPVSKGSSFAERRAYSILDGTTIKVGDRWETGLLWKDDQPSLPASYSMAYKRLLCTERKMQNSEFRRKYNEKIQEYRDKNYIRKLTEEELEKKPCKQFYIPHFGVYNPNKPGKFRLVFDAAAKVCEKSLNDFLLTGPDLIRPLTSVLLNFRIHQVALTGDIADMFHRVRIRDEDQPAQRFLWRDGDNSKQPEHYQMEVMIFGATCSPASAIYVKNRNAERFKDQFPLAVEVILKDMYVDDACSGGPTAHGVIQLRKQLSDINGAGGFVICKFASNSPEVMASIPTELQAEGLKGFSDKDDVSSERVLGLWWDPHQDIFSFKLVLHKVKPEVLAGRTPTKRELCSLVMSLYDPLGFITHYKVKGIMMLQETWMTGIGWDDELPKSMNEKWKNWLEMLQGITLVNVPRCYSPYLLSCTDLQLHTFVDASEEAFAAVCYLRVKWDQGVDVAFLCSKAKVAPIKKLTIPRLELQAAVLGTRMAAMIKEELRLPVHSRVFWSDSRTVLSWVRSTDRKFKEFVANRVGEIQEETNPSEWRWIPTKHNVADLATRYCSEISFEKDSVWYSGPPHLKEDLGQWPVEILPDTGPDEESEAGCLFAVVGGEPRIGLSSSERCGLGSMDHIQGVVPDPSRFSTYLRLVRATAAVQLCAKVWMSKVLHRGPLELKWTAVISKKKGKRIRVITSSPISAADVELAEKSLIKLAQSDSFQAEISILETRSNPKQVRQVLKKGRIWRLSPFVQDDGILRMDGRIKAATVKEDVKFPAILPSNHRITELLIDLEHVRACHQGIGTVMVALQQKFVILSMKEAVKRNARRCQFCKLRKCQPIHPKMGDLPYFRLESGNMPFHYTGLDFFGPLEVTVGRHREKRWGALFSCMTTRAVHLEVAHSLSTDEALLAISRFIDSRGRPHTILSDNGTNFVGAARELKENLQNINFDSLMEFGKFQEIKWIFQAARSPHMSGAWERLVGSVKKCLFALLKEKHPKDTTLLTFMKAAENVVNSRPLTIVSNDPLDPTPITPNDILRGGSDVGPSIPAEMDSSDEFNRAQWRRSQLLADTFWQRWTKEFLPQLLRREKWLESVDPLQVGDLVFLVDELLPRNVWRRGYITKIFPKGGQVRVVDVTLKDPVTKRTSVRRRAAGQVCPIGLRMEIRRVEGASDLGPDCHEENDVGKEKISSEEILFPSRIFKNAASATKEDTAPEREKKMGKARKN